VSGAQPAGQWDRLRHRGGGLGQLPRRRAADRILYLGGVNLTGPLTVLAVYAAAGTLLVPVAAAWRQHRPGGPPAAGQTA
jgi:hypothetical protein